MTIALFPRPLDAEPLRELFLATRARSLALVDGLHVEDMTVQSMEEASPTKWHLAHTTWFFEEFVLRAHLPRYRSPDDRFAWLFNSYYVQAGPRYARARRGLVTRPTVADILAYREAVDAIVADGLAAGELPPDIVELGCHHEMQHQELMLTDLLHALSHNPLHPVYRAPEPLPLTSAAPLVWHALEGGIARVGHGADTFAFDCEGPRHETLLRPFEIASRLVTAGEWIEFIDDGGYAEPTLWLSDGWAARESEGWEAPAYWFREDDAADGAWHAFGLRGAQPLDLDAPVAHVSFFEADAFARWRGARLPSEFERETTEAATRPDAVGDGRDGARVAWGADGALLESGRLRPAPATGAGLAQLRGDAWEWTASPFVAYPGFRAPEGAVGEYNGKFMNGQYVLRGGSALTPTAQLRDTYRNFFPPQSRWQMSGLRLARDITAHAGHGDVHGVRGGTRHDASGGARVRTDDGGDERPVQPSAISYTSSDLAESLRASLARRPRAFDPKWFYDARGSALFERICQTDAYYITRVELDILERHAASMAACIGPGAVLFEPGAGAMSKARPLLAALERPAAYVPADIDPLHMGAAVDELRGRLPELRVEPLELDLSRTLALPPALAALGPVTAFFPGSTIGNFDPDAARDLLGRLRTESGATRLLIGVDRPPGASKSEARLVRAYDDEGGVTAAFNKNLLVRANAELGAGFDVDAFRHVARYDALHGRIEMHLVCERTHHVRIADERFRIDAGETLLTEMSWKYPSAAFDAMAADAGWRRADGWSDGTGWFALTLYESG